MKSPFVSILRVMPLLLILSVRAPAQVSKAELRNDLGLEFLGRCKAFALSYQRFTSDYFGIECGASLLGGSERFDLASLSVGVRTYVLSGNAAPYVSGGIAISSASNSDPTFSKSNTSLYAYFGPGFEYRWTDGFLIRGTIYSFIGKHRNDFFADSHLFLWPGIQVGVAF